MEVVLDSDRYVIMEYVSQQAEEFRFDMPIFLLNPVIPRANEWQFMTAHLLRAGEAKKYCVGDFLPVLQ